MQIQPTQQRQEERKEGDHEGETVKQVIGSLANKMPPFHTVILPYYRSASRHIFKANNFNIFQGYKTYDEQKICF